MENVIDSCEMAKALELLLSSNSRLPHKLIQERIDWLRKLK